MLRMRYWHGYWKSLGCQYYKFIGDVIGKFIDYKLSYELWHGHNTVMPTNDMLFMTRDMVMTWL